VAHLRSIAKHCEFQEYRRLLVCGKPATNELRNWRNDLMGYYCLKHSSIRLNELNAKEKETPRG
jgi:hypothetical protein